LLKSAEGEIVNHVKDGTSIMAVPAYLDSILINFLSNAIKYRSPERDPIITLTLTEEDGRVVLAISDNGIGIDLERHGQKLFGMYRTFHDNKDARGIGLFITKNQLEAMGGMVKVSSTVGQGTTFSLSFRKAPANS